MSALFAQNRTFRFAVIFTGLCFFFLVFLITYGILMIRPDHIAEKRDVALARAALELRLKEEDRKRQEQHADLMKRLKFAMERQSKMKVQQDQNLKAIREIKAKLK